MASDKQNKSNTSNRNNSNSNSNNSSNNSQGSSFGDFISNGYSTALLLENYDLSKEAKLWYGIVFSLINSCLMGLTGLLLNAIYDDMSNYLTLEFFKKFSTVIVSVSVGSLALLFICSFISKLYLAANSFSSVFSLLSIQTAFLPLVFIIYIYDSQTSSLIKYCNIILVSISVFFIKCSIDESSMKDVSIFRKVVVYIFSGVFFFSMYWIIYKMMNVYIES